jgi:hypothetical protein
MSDHQWTEEDRVQLFFIIEREWARLDTDAWEALDDEEKDSPPGAIAVWEGPGFKDKSRKQCWVIPGSVAVSLIASDPCPRRTPRD